MRTLMCFRFKTNDVVWDELFEKFADHDITPVADNRGLDGMIWTLANDPKKITRNTECVETYGNRYVDIVIEDDLAKNAVRRFCFMERDF